MVCDQMIDRNTNQLMVWTYDHVAKQYRVFSLGQDRIPVVGQATINADKWTAIAGFEQEGRRFQIRTVTDFSQPGSYTDRQEHSEDGGLALDAGQPRTGYQGAIGNHAEE